MVKSKFYLSVFIFVFFISTALTYAQGAVMRAPSVEEELQGSTMETQAYVKPGYVTVNFKNADIKAVLNYLSEVGGVDIVTSPDVAGTVTLKLTDKPWDQALDIIVKNYGFTYEREGDIIRVVTVESLRLAELATEVMHLNYTDSKEAYDAVKDMLTSRGKIRYDQRTNSVIVTDLPTNIYKIRQVIDKLDKETPQVMIQARIFETILENDEKMGIDWTMKISAIGAKRPTTLPFHSWGTKFLGAEARQFFPIGQTGNQQAVGGIATTTTTETPDFGTTPDGPVSFPLVDADAFTYGTLDFSQFQAVLELLKQRKRTEVISNPRVTTLNNKEAKILVGRVYNFPTFSQAEETGRWIISGYQAKELGIKLLVTPHVNEKGEIVVDLKPEISNFLGMEKISEELSAPLWDTREADTQIMVRDGDTIFIGGLIRESVIDLDKKVPILGDLFGDPSD